MADYLLVADMQSDYVAVGKAYHEELTAAAMTKLSTYPSDRVIYILNRFSKRKDRKEEICDRLAGCVFVFYSVGLRLLIQI